MWVWLDEPQGLCRLMCDLVVCFLLLGWQDLRSTSWMMWDRHCLTGPLPLEHRKWWVKSNISPQTIARNTGFSWPDIICFFAIGGVSVWAGCWCQSGFTILLSTLRCLLRSSPNCQGNFLVTLQPVPGFASVVDFWQVFIWSLCSPVFYLYPSVLSLSGSLFVDSVEVWC